MAQKYYSVMTKNGINIVNNLLYEDTETLFTDGWNISLGTGNLEPTSDTTELINPVLDKNSVDYPDITFGKHEIYGHYAEITIPECVKGNVLTECGLFNEEGILIAVSKIHLDLTETMLDNGIDLTAKQRIYIQAVPAATNIIYTPQGDLINKELLNLELRNYQKLSEKGVENGYCELDENKKVPLINIPSSIANNDLSNLSSTGESHFVKPSIAVTHQQATSVGSSTQPVYVGANGNTAACSGLDSNVRCTSRATISSTKGDWVVAQNLSGTSGYRIWASGFKECWGNYVGGTTNAYNVEITFTLGSYNFSDTPQLITSSSVETAYANAMIGDVDRNTITFKAGSYNRLSSSGFYIDVTGRDSRTLHWYAFGY